MKAFEYATALSTDSACELVAGHGAYLAGGNDLLGLLKDYLVPGPDILVNIKSLPGLNKIEPGAKHWTLGALVTVGQIENSPEVKAAFPGLHEAASEIASQQIRNVATVGGNLAQHSRCWYFRHRDTVCLKKNGDLCYARNGENRYHSLFTGNDCISPVVSSLAVIFTALDATAAVLRDGLEDNRRAQFAQPRRPDFARGNPAGAQPQRVFAGERQARLRLGAGQLRGGGGSCGWEIKITARRAGRHFARAAPGPGRQ
jgi:CO/xanthine dehydrogenase FAD-binding subunit